MSRRLTDVFDLVASLTHGEYLTLIDEMWRSRFTKKMAQGEIPQYAQLVEYLRKKEHFDDKAAKRDLGFDNLPAGTWRDLKRETINKILIAIERTRSNSTERAKVQRGVELVQTMIDRQIWGRADKMAIKLIAIAEKIEKYGNVLDLIKLRTFIVVSSYPPQEITKEVEKLQILRRKARKRFLNIEDLQEVYFQMMHQARRGHQRDDELVNQLLNDPLVSRTGYESVWAERYYWLIRRIGARLTRDFSGYRDALTGAVSFFRKEIRFVTDAEFRRFGITMFSEKASFHAMTHDFENAEKYITELEKLSKAFRYSPKEKVELEARVFMQKMILARFRLQPAEIAKQSIIFFKWYQRNYHLLTEGMALRMVRRASINAFFVEEYSVCVKLIYRFLTKEPSRFRPAITSFLWIFLVIIRVSQSDSAALYGELRTIKKYLKEYEKGNKLYHAIYELGILACGKGIEADGSKIIEPTLARILKLSKLPENKRHEQQFPFFLWCKSFVGKTPFFEALRSDNNPLTAI